MGFAQIFHAEFTWLLSKKYQLTSTECQLLTDVSPISNLIIEVLTTNEGIWRGTHLIPAKLNLTQPKS